MWTSLCNFLCQKLFNRSDVKPTFSENVCNDYIYGKRMKLSSSCAANSLLNPAGTPPKLSMQTNGNLSKEDDEEEECCVIAEIPRRRKVGKSLHVSKKPNYYSSTDVSKNIDLFTASKPEYEKKCDSKEIEVLKYITSNTSSKTLKERSCKFFNTQRASLSQSKLAKSKTVFKNHLKRKLNFLQESYRLTEKFQYMQLLQSHTSCDLLVVKPPLKKVKRASQIIPIIDLIDDKTSETEEQSKNDYSHSSNKISEDQDFQILKEIPGFRSFQDALKIRPVSSFEIVHEVLPESPKKILPALPDFIELKDDDDDDDDSPITVLDIEDEEASGDKTCTDSLEEKLRAFMKITGSDLRKVKNDLGEQYYLPQLTLEQEKAIQAALEPEPRDEILARDFGLEIARRDMQTLNGSNWLNDEVINFYMNLIMGRSNRNKTLPKVYAFNTFFYPKLISGGYESLRRWTKKVDIFSFDIILVPIHLGMHWCLSIIDFRCKSIHYYDSIGSPNDACLERLLVYIKEESLDKKKKSFSTVHWEKSSVKDIPQQMNGSDCGVFSCVFAEHLARDSAILFDQNDMPYFRKKIIIEILEGKLLT